MNALIIPVFNRSEYLFQCLASLKEAHWPSDIMIILINDGSTDPEAIKLYATFEIPNVPIIRINQNNTGIRGALLAGYETAWKMNCEIAMNLDSDAIVKADFIDKIIMQHCMCVNHIVTGFHSVNKNRDGSERHQILQYGSTMSYCFKKSVGGINMCMNKEQFEKYCRPTLFENANWDHRTSINCEKAGFPIACLIPSVIQHIGFSSSMNHSEPPDVASDFYNLDLPNVTLFGADTIHFPELQKAAQISQRDIKFGAVRLITTPEVNFKSKQDYSLFMIRSLTEYVETSHVLVIQHDGYVLSFKAWEDEFLSVDFLGSSWWYKSGGNVGNGGFSLRSKKLCDILATDPEIQETHPEDHHICRTYRPYLEKKYGIKFGTYEMANRFAIESAYCPDNKYSGQFGFHGRNVDFSGSNLPHIPYQLSKPGRVIEPIPKKVGTAQFKWGP